MLEWKGVPSHKGQLPSHIYAFWTEPDGAFQEERFGRVALRGEALETYVLWYAGLSPGEQRQWDGLLAGLQPGDDVPARIRQFVFQGPDGKPIDDHPTDEAPPSESGRDLLLEVLEAEQEGLPVQGQEPSAEPRRDEQQGEQ